MKKGLLAVVVIAVLVVGGLVAYKFMASKSPEVSGPSAPYIPGVEKPVTEVMAPMTGQVAIADVVPNDTVVFLSARNARSTWDAIKTSNFWSRVSGLKLWQTAQLGTGMAAFKEQLRTNTGFDLSEENILGIFGQDLSLALIGSKEGLANPQLLVLTQTDPRIDIKSKLNVMLEKVRGNVTVEKAQYNGYEISRVRNPQVPGPEFNYALIGNVFALGIGIDDSGVRNVIDLVAKKSADSLGMSQQYKESVGALKVRGDLRGVIYINMSRIVELIKSLPTPEGTPAGFAAGLEQTLGAIRSISGAIGLDRGMLVKLYFLKNPQAGQSQLLSGWEAAPRAAESLKFLPEDSLLLTVSNSLDFGSIWDGWQSNLQVQNPDQAKAIMDGVAQFEADSGLKVKEDILAMLGEEVCFAVTNIDMTGLFPFPHIAVLAKVKDAAKAEQTMKKLVDYAVLKSAPQGVTPVAPGEEATEGAPAAQAGALAQMKSSADSYAGVAIKSLEIQLPYQTLNPSYAVVNGFLVIGVNKDTAKSIIDVSKGTKKSVRTSKSFTDSTGSFSEKVNQIAFLNLDRTLNLVVEIVKWANNLQKARGEAGAQTDQLIQENVLPMLETLKVFKAVAVEAVNQEKGIEETLYIQMEDLKES